MCEPFIEATSGIYSTDNRDQVRKPRGPDTKNRFKQSDAKDEANENHKGKQE
ncbi:hypothetical protein [Kangiella sp.]|uniref:hypothetical protein n=1 Tax=Kangiella sp. TaxID=1920245 RepID=UPI003A8E1776